MVRSLGRRRDPRGPRPTLPAIDTLEREKQQLKESPAPAYRQAAWIGSVEKNDPVPAGIHDLVITFTFPGVTYLDENGEVELNGVGLDLFPSRGDRLVGESASEDGSSVTLKLNLPDGQTYVLFVLLEDAEDAVDYHFGFVSLSDATVSTKDPGSHALTPGGRTMNFASMRY